MNEVAIPEPDRRARDYPHQLSGGMRQRIMIAMAIVNRPQFSLPTNPPPRSTSPSRRRFSTCSPNCAPKFGLAMLFISHDLAVVSQVADRVAVMYAGNIVELGAKRDIFQSPAHPYTRGLLHAVPNLKTDRDRSSSDHRRHCPGAARMPAGCAFEPRCGFRIPHCARDFPPW